MDVRILRYFLAVAREETITKAAESLHIAQPSLSKQMMELERELGKTLFLRGKRKVTLTEDGAFLRKRAEEIVALVEKTERELSSDVKELSGEVAIGGTASRSVLRAAASLREKHPGVQFHFYSGDAMDVEERLTHGTLDFSVLLMPIDRVKYDALQLPEQSQWGLLVQRGSPLATEPVMTRDRFLDAPLILHQRVGLQREISLWAQTELNQLNIAATYNVAHGDPVKFVESGLGAFLLSRDQLPEELDGSVQFLPLEPPLSIRYALVWNRYGMRSKAAERFLEELKEII